MNYFDLLGHKCLDVVTGYEGVAESLSFDLYGCIQVALRPVVGKGAKPGDYPDGRWFDVERLKVISEKPVMNVPSFDEAMKGPADKPGRSQPPRR